MVFVFDFQGNSHRFYQHKSSMKNVATTSTFTRPVAEEGSCAPRHGAKEEEVEERWGSGFSVPGMVFSLPEVLFSRIWARKVIENREKVYS